MSGCARPAPQDSTRNKTRKVNLPGQKSHDRPASQGPGKYALGRETIRPEPPRPAEAPAARCPAGPRTPCAARQPSPPCPVESNEDHRMAEPPGLQLQQRGGRNGRADHEPPGRELAPGPGQRAAGPGRIPGPRRWRWGNFVGGDVGRPRREAATMHWTNASPRSSSCANCSGSADAGGRIGSGSRPTRAAEPRPSGASGPGSRSTATNGVRTRTIGDQRSRYRAGLPALAASACSSDLELGLLECVEQPRRGSHRPVLGHPDRVVQVEAVRRHRGRVGERKNGQHGRGHRCPEGVQGAVEVDRPDHLG